MSATPNWEITFLFIMTPYIWKEVFGKRNFFSLLEIVLNLSIIEVG